LRRPVATNSEGSPKWQKRLGIKVWTRLISLRAQEVADREVCDPNVSESDYLGRLQNPQKPLSKVLKVVLGSHNFALSAPLMLLRELGAARPSGFVEPCRPSRATRPPSGPDWVHEIKHDGFRLMVRREGARVRLWTRGGYDWADRFPRIVEARGNAIVRRSRPAPRKRRPLLHEKNATRW